MKMKNRLFLIATLCIILGSCTNRLNNQISKNDEAIRTKHSAVEERNGKISKQEDTIRLLQNKLAYLKSDPRILLDGVDLFEIMCKTDDYSLEEIRSIYQDLSRYHPLCEELKEVREIYEFRKLKAEEKKIFESFTVQHDDFKNYTWYSTSRFKNVEGTNYLSLYISCKGKPVKFDELCLDAVPSIRLKVNYSGDYLEMNAVQLYCDGKIFSIKPGFFDDVIDYGLGLLEDSWATLDVPVSDYNGLRSFLYNIPNGKDVRIRVIGDNITRDRSITQEEITALYEILVGYQVLFDKLPECSKPSMADDSYSLRQLYHSLTTIDI